MCAINVVLGKLEAVTKRIINVGLGSKVHNSIDGLGDEKVVYKIDPSAENLVVKPNSEETNEMSSNSFEGENNAVVQEHLTSNPNPDAAVQEHLTSNPNPSEGDIIERASET